MLCEAMAAAWAAGRAAPVRQLMLVPQGGNSACVVRMHGFVDTSLGCLLLTWALLMCPTRLC